MRFELKEVFIVNERTCVVVGVRMSDILGEAFGIYKREIPQAVKKYYADSHNGYVSADRAESSRIHDEVDEEFTYGGYLDQYVHPLLEGKKWFVGFDTGHVWDTQESKSFESVRARVEALAYALDYAGFKQDVVVQALIRQGRLIGLVAGILYILCWVLILL